jgi:hypothetical protein
VRTGQDAGGEEPDDRREPYPLGDQDRDGGHGEDGQQILEEVNGFHRPTLAG